MNMFDADFWKDCPVVEVVPGRLNGQPVVRNTRVEADLIPECEQLGETAEETASHYGLKLKDVQDIRSYVANHAKPALAS
jgi:uncharacterized protein (DUF433 family)